MKNKGNILKYFKKGSFAGIFQIISSSLNYYILSTLGGMMRRSLVFK
jgi:hypothetical protein